RGVLLLTRRIPVGRGRSGESKGSYRCVSASPTREECNPMNPNSALSAWQLAVMAVIPVAALAMWLTIIFLAGKEPRGHAQAAAASHVGADAPETRSGYVVPAPVTGDGEPERPADGGIAA